jgi:hypothetical protein
MGKKLYPTDTLKQAQSIVGAWKLIDPSLKVGALTLEAVAANVATVQDLRQKIIQLQTQLIDIRNQRDAATIELWRKVKQTRYGIKGFYGDDSSEYKLAGGTRSSEKKKPRRKSIPDSSK